MAQTKNGHPSVEGAQDVEAFAVSSVSSMLEGVGLEDQYREILAGIG